MKKKSVLSFGNRDYIYVSNEAGKEPVKTDPEKFANSLGCTWVESLCVDADQIYKFQGLTFGIKIHDEVFLSIIKTIDKNNEKLAISYINEEVGYGVFARQDIPENDYVAVCAGQLEVISEMSYYFYGVQYHDSENAGYIVDASTHRNMAAFFQHLPNAVMTMK